MNLKVKPTFELHNALYSTKVMVPAAYDNPDVLFSESANKRNLQVY